MSNFRNGKCLEVGYDSLSVICRPSAGNSIDFFKFTREELLARFEKDKEKFGWVDLDTLDTHKPNGMVVKYHPDTYMFDTEWDRGQKQPLMRGETKYVPLSTLYAKS